MNLLAFLLAASSLAAMLRFKPGMGWMPLASRLVGIASFLVTGPESRPVACVESLVAQFPKHL